ncbi:Hypothetical predicted protein [Mytilus galloprovincialis]|uniref:Uncharacterized protein n=1 Tax=Mytilus galloprovincialis TaxID=29158 RepID=A0A8B6E929_MYTGA|nr:Hypothetical predicted protein [Mytilus galloprovincialis]
MDPREQERYETLKQMYESKSVSECFASLHLKLEGDVETLRTEVKVLRDNVENLESHAKLMEDSIKDVHNTLLPDIEEKISTEEKERLKLEYWGRKWNLVISGVRGSPLTEMPKATDVYVRSFFEKNLEITKERIEKMLFQAVHRLPGKESDKEKRKIIVRFNSLIDRDDVLAAGMKLKRGSGYSVVPDVPPSVAKQRFNLLNEIFRRALPSSEQRNVHLVYIKDIRLLC